MFVGRELTKKFETLWWGNLDEYLIFRKTKSLNNSNELAGEYVLVFDFSSCNVTKDCDREIDAWINALRKYVKPSELATVMSKQFDVPKRVIYKRIINT